MDGRFSPRAPSSPFRAFYNWLFELGYYCLAEDYLWSLAFFSAAYGPASFASAAAVLLLVRYGDAKSAVWSFWPLIYASWLIYSLPSLPSRPPPASSSPEELSTTSPRLAVGVACFLMVCALSVNLCYWAAWASCLSFSSCSFFRRFCSLSFSFCFLIRLFWSCWVWNISYTYVGFGVRFGFVLNLGLISAYFSSSLSPLSSSDIAFSFAAFGYSLSLVDAGFSTALHSPFACFYSSTSILFIDSLPYLPVTMSFSPISSFLSGIFDFSATFSATISFFASTNAVAATLAATPLVAALMPLAYWCYSLARRAFFKYEANLFESTLDCTSCYSARPSGCFLNALSLPHEERVPIITPAPVSSIADGGGSCLLNLASPLFLDATGADEEESMNSSTFSFLLEAFISSFIDFGIWNIGCFSTGLTYSYLLGGDFDALSLRVDLLLFSALVRWASSDPDNRSSSSASSSSSSSLSVWSLCSIFISRSINLILSLSIGGIYSLACLIPSCNFYNIQYIVNTSLANRLWYIADIITLYQLNFSNSVQYSLPQKYKINLPYCSSSQISCSYQRI